MNELSQSRHKDKYLIGTGLNSLSETINLMKVATSLNFNDFLIMPPAYYKYGDKEVIEFYSRVVDAVPSTVKLFYITLKNYVAINLVLSVLKNL